MRLKTGSCTTAAQQWSMQILWILVPPESRHSPFALCGSGCGKNVPLVSAHEKISGEVHRQTQPSQLPKTLKSNHNKK